MNHDAPPLYVDRHFTIRPCTTCAVPGYLVVIPIERVASLTDMSSEALAALGPTLALATRAIETALQPERIYCGLFAEETRHVHFHVFPRTAEIARRYFEAHPDRTAVSGPHLMEWARRVWKQTSAGGDDISKRISALLQTSSPNLSSRDLENP